MELSKKAQRIEPSVTLEITAKAKEMKENGVDVISFGAGEPDFNTPKNIIDAAIKAMNDGNTKYTSVNGILPLREAICKKFKEDNGLFYKPSQIVVSTGAKQSLANTFLAILLYHSFLFYSINRFCYFIYNKKTYIQKSFLNFYLYSCKRNSLSLFIIIP